MVSVIAVVIGAVSAIVGAIVSGLFNYFNTKKREEEASKRKRGEIYLEKKLEYLVDLDIALKETIETLVAYSQSADRLKKVEKIEDPDIRPELRVEITEELSEARSDFSKAGADLKDAFAKCSAFLDTRQEAVLYKSLFYLNKYSFNRFKEYVSMSKEKSDVIPDNEIETNVRDYLEQKEEFDVEAELLQNFVDELKENPEVQDTIEELREINKQIEAREELMDLSIDSLDYDPGEIDEIEEHTLVLLDRSRNMIQSELRKPVRYFE